MDVPRAVRRFFRLIADPNYVEQQCESAPYSAAVLQRVSGAEASPSAASAAPSAAAAAAPAAAAPTALETLAERLRPLLRTVVGSAALCAAANALTSALARRLVSGYDTFDVFDRREFVARVVALGHAVYCSERAVRLIWRWFRGRSFVAPMHRAFAVSTGYWLYDTVNSLRMGGKADILVHHAASVTWMMFNLASRANLQFAVTSYLTPLTDGIVHVVWLLRKAGLAPALGARLWNSLVHLEVGSFVAVRFVYYLPIMVAYYRSGAARAESGGMRALRSLLFLLYCIYNFKWFGELYRSTTKMLL